MQARLGGQTLLQPRLSSTCILSFNSEEGTVVEMVLSKFPVAQTVKNPPEMQETWVRSLGREDPLEEGMATHSSILAWRIPWTEEPGGL